MEEFGAGCRQLGMTPPGEREGDEDPDRHPDQDRESEVAQHPADRGEPRFRSNPTSSGSSHSTEDDREERT